MGQRREGKKGLDEMKGISQMRGRRRDRKTSKREMRKQARRKAVWTARKRKLLIKE